RARSVSDGTTDGVVFAEQGDARRLAGEHGRREKGKRAVPRTRPSPRRVPSHPSLTSPYLRPLLGEEGCETRSARLRRILGEDDVELENVAVALLLDVDADLIEIDLLVLREDLQ